MQTLPYVVLVIIAGAAIAFQSPINASLGRVVGPFNSAFVSFAVGVIVTFTVANLTDGLGRLQGISQAQPWHFLGGVLGVVLVTALESREDRERGIDVGANAYIVKHSFEQSNLLEVVRRLI